MLEKVTILDVGSEGKAVARVNDLVVFVPWVAPGDIVDIQVLRKKRNYLEGKAVKFHQLSETRQEPFCRHFGICGGCRWQHLPYAEQLRYKEKQVADAFTRIGKLDLPGISPIRPSPRERFYRNKLEYSFSGRRWHEGGVMDELADSRTLGFHMPGMFDRVLQIEACYLQPDPSNQIREHVRSFCLERGYEFWDARSNTGFLRNLIIRNSNAGDLMVILVVAAEELAAVREILDSLSDAFPRVNSLFYVINQKQNDSLSDQTAVLYRGKGYMEEQMEPLRFRIGPLSFFQVNPEQAAAMYALAAEVLQLTGTQTVYDLYTGTGTIANFLAGRAARVVGIEYVQDAVDDAAMNSSLNGIGNTRFYAGDMLQVFDQPLFSREGPPEVLVADPPRAGMHEKIIQKILAVAPERMVYISCNPATQARDLAMLASGYTVRLVQPFDMFPQTHHVECLTYLERNSG